MYEPQVDDYVIWHRPNGDVEEGWVYFKGDPPVHKQGWNECPQYITIELGTKPKPHCVYSSGKPMRHKMIHILLLCYQKDWKDLEYIRNRRDELTSDRPPVSTDTYKSQEYRYSDPQ